MESTRDARGTTMRASATTSAYRATSRAPLEGARARSRGLAFASRRARPARGNFGRLISDMSPSTLAPNNGENAALGAGAAGGGVSFPADDAASSELSDRGRRTLARALGNVETPSGSLGLHFSSHPLDHAGKVDAAASAPAAFRPRQSNVVARAKGDDKPRDASKDLAAGNPESQPEHPDPVAAADPADENAASDEADAAEKDHPDAPEPAAPAAAADDDDDAPAAAASAAAASVVAATSAASTDRGALRAIVDNAEVLCLVAAGGVKAAQIRARLAASPRGAASRDARFVASRASAAPPPALPAYADWVADGALFGAMAVGAILRRTGVINNVVPTRRASATGRSASAAATVADAAAEGQLTDVVERVRARAARLAEVKKTLADSRSDLNRAAEAATAATAAAKAKAAEAAATTTTTTAKASGPSGPSVVAEADARAAAAQEMAEAARRRAVMFGEETSKTRYFSETQEWSEETAVTRTVRSTRAGSGPPPPLGSATDAPAFGRELAPPRERTTIDAFTGSMEAMEVDQEMIDLRAEVERLRAAAEAYEAGEEDDYFDVEKRR